MTELAHRYAPVWHQDVLVAVKKKPKPYVDLLMAESAVINAAIDLGTERSVEAANRFGKAVHLNLRKIYGMDLQSAGSRDSRGSDPRAGAAPREPRRRPQRHWGAPKR